MRPTPPAWVWRQGGTSTTVARLHVASAQPGAAAPSSALRYLPQVVVATSFVTVLPVLVVAVLLPTGGLGWSVGALLLSIALSIALGRVAAAYWMRRPHSTDLVFADLMVWGWLRRLWAEHGMARARRAVAASEAKGARTQVEALERLGRTLEARDAYTHGHSQRVARHAGRIARAMHLSAAEVAKIRTAAAVHDVGKIFTPREILNKPGRLTDEEFAIIKRHAADGAQMLKPIGDVELVAMVRHHHERLDGRGYPDGLAGEAIPLGARIIAVADTFDALTSSRAYRGASVHKRALNVLAAEAGTQLDAAAVDAFLSCYSGQRSVLWTALLAAIPQRLVAALKQSASTLGGAAASIGQALSVVGVAATVGVAPSVPAGAPERAPSTTTAVSFSSSSPSQSERSPQTTERPRPAPAPKPSSPVSEPPATVSQQVATASAPTTPTIRPQVPVTPPSRPVELPTVRVPELPEVRTPRVTVPPVAPPATPAVTVGDVTVPPVQLPSTPAITVGEVTIVPARN